jgi:hypothetical protein
MRALNETTDCSDSRPAKPLSQTSVCPGSGARSASSRAGAGDRIEQHLDDRETDELAVRDPNGTTALPSAWQEVIDEHVNVRQQRAEVGGHRGLLVDGVLAPPTSAPCCRSL